MGMFDYVDFEFPCPRCGYTVTEFQTKDLKCEMISIKKYDISKLTRFYSSCDHCRHWVEFEKNRKRRRTHINHKIWGSVTFLPFPKSLESFQQRNRRIHIND